MFEPHCNAGKGAFERKRRRVTDAFPSRDVRFRDQKQRAFQSSRVARSGWAGGFGKLHIRKPTRQGCQRVPRPKPLANIRRIEAFRSDGVMLNEGADGCRLSLDVVLDDRAGFQALQTGMRRLNADCRTDGVGKFRRAGG
jgi:hypothetical protein